MDVNLKYTIMRALTLLGFHNFDKEKYFKEVLKKKYDPIASYNYKACKTIENYYQTLSLSNYPLECVEELEWAPSSGIIEDIWPQWDGEDGYFDIDSLDGIEICSEVKSLIIQFLWNVKNIEPLVHLKKLEYLYVWSTSEESIETLTPLLELNNLKEVFFVDIRVLDIKESDKILDKLKERGVKVKLALAR